MEQGEVNAKQMHGESKAMQGKENHKSQGKLCNLKLFKPDSFRFQNSTFLCTSNVKENWIENMLCLAGGRPDPF